jgi:electron transport complex protein RnfC
LPYKIDELSQDEDYDGCKKFGVEYCTKCGCCSYVCPTKRHLVQRISYAKDVIDGKGGERI